MQLLYRQVIINRLLRNKVVSAQKAAKRKHQGRIRLLMGAGLANTSRCEKIPKTGSKIFLFNRLSKILPQSGIEPQIQNNQTRLRSLTKVFITRDRAYAQHNTELYASVCLLWPSQLSEGGMGFLHDECHHTVHHCSMNAAKLVNNENRKYELRENIERDA